MSRKSYYLSTAAAVGMLISASVSSAATITLDMANPLGGAAGTYGQLTDVGTSLSLYGLLFPQFDSALGTLSSISLTLDIDYDTVVTVSALSAATGYAELQTSFKAFTPGGKSLTDTFILGSFDYSLDAGQTVSNEDSIGPKVEVKLVNDTTDLAAFTGTGNATVGFYTSTASLLSATGGTATGSQVTQLDMQGTVTYTYTPTPPPSTDAPEPMTAAVLAAGLAGLAAVRRRKA